MSTFTENYNLIKPSGEDYYDIQDFNENMDTLDAVLMANEGAAAEISEKIGTPADTGTETLFGCMKSGGSVIKSIQRITHATTSIGTTSLPLEAIDVSKSFVIMERTFDLYEKGIRDYSYVLNSNSLDVTVSASEGYPRKFAFWIIEFN